MQKNLIAEEELIALLKQGGRAGYDYLYKNYSATLYGIVLRILPNEDQGKDALQDTFIKIWKNINQYDPTKGRLYTWMANVARNVAIDTLRSKAHQNFQKNQNIEDSVNTLDTLRNNEPKVELIGVKELVKELKKDQRELINLVYFAGYTQEEAAKEIGIPLGTVKTRIRAAMLTMRGIFADKEQLN